MKNQIFLHFSGPYALCSEEYDVLSDCNFNNKVGVYLWAVQLGNSYRITYIGETGASFYQRTKDHLIQALGGNYRICDVAAMREGIEKILWDGLWRKGTRDKLPELMKRYVQLAPYIKEYLQAQVVFVAPTNCDPRLRKRIEASIASSLQADKANSSLLPADIRFIKRKDREAAVHVVITSDREIIGLPSEVIA